MNAYRTIALVALLVCAQSAQAVVFRCSGRSGIYYSDKGCKPGDALAPSSGKGSMSIVGNGGGRRGGANAPAPKFQTQNRYTQRAEAGANRANQAQGTK